MPSSWVDDCPSVIITTGVHAENGVDDLVVDLDGIASMRPPT